MNFLRQYKDIMLHGSLKDKVVSWGIIALIIWIISSTVIGFISPKEEYIPTSDFVYQLQQGNIAEMHISNIDGSVNGEFKEPIDGDVKLFSSNIPERSETFTQQYLNTGNIQWDYSKDPAWISSITNILLMVLQIGLLVGAMMWIMSKMSGDSSMFPFGGGDDENKWTPENVSNVTFDDVLGVPEAIEEVQEILTYLKDPALYEQAGSEMPKGILLASPPGCGKTLLAKALASESDSGFLSANGSDFVKMYVGQGAKAVRELFKKARAFAPDKCIIFIDEIDSLAQARSNAGDSGAEKEYSSTVNALLSCMDGATDDNSNILVIGATNRPDSLDPALMRKGRFDRIIQLDPPAKEGRKEILQHYAQNRPFAELVDFERLAKHTYGFSGADLKNVMNEASTLAARRAIQEGGVPAITKEDLDEGISRTISGPAMKSRKMNDEEKRQVAYHEAGHAVVQYLLPECDPVQKISIVSRNIAGVGAAMGYVQSYSEEDSYVTTSSKMNAEIAALMGGRCSEKIHCGIESAGACDDLRKASGFAYDMVNKYAFENPQGEQNSWRVDVTGGRNTPPSQQYLQQVDERIEQILDKGYSTAYRILMAHRREVEKIVETLLEEETIDAEQITEIMESSKKEQEDDNE